MNKNKKNHVYGIIFDTGVKIGLAPINFLLRNFTYYAAMPMSIFLIITWSFPVITVASVISNIALSIEVCVKLVKSKINCGTYK